MNTQDQAQVMTPAGATEQGVISTGVRARLTMPPKPRGRPKRSPETLAVYRMLHNQYEEILRLLARGGLQRGQGRRDSEPEIRWTGWLVKLVLYAGKRSSAPGLADLPAEVVEEWIRALPATGPIRDRLAYRMLAYAHPSLRPGRTTTPDTIRGRIVVARKHQKITSL